MQTSASPPLKLYPVVVGVNHYQASTTALSFDLKYAARDAERVAAFLRTGNQTFQTVDFQPFIDKQATSERVRQALREVWGAQQLGKGDVLFFYFAGHGMVLPDGRAFLCCYDTNFRDPYSGGLRLDDLYGDMQGVSMFRKVTAETVMVVLDACYSGSIVSPGVVNHNPAQQLQAALSNMLPQATSHRVVFSAAHANQRAREKQFTDGGAGVFTYALLEGWRDGKAAGSDGSITQFSLAGYLQQKFAGNVRQKPMTAITGGDVLLFGIVQQAALETTPVSVPSEAAQKQNTFTWWRTLLQKLLPASPEPPSTVYTPETGRRLPVQAAPHFFSGNELATLVSAAAVALILLSACALLVVFSPFFFSLGFGFACLLALISIGAAGIVAGRLWVVAGLLTIVQAALLAGVAHHRFGLAAGVEALGVLDRFGWVAVLIFLIQFSIVLFAVVKRGSGR